MERKIKKMQVGEKAGKAGKVCGWHWNSIHLPRSGIHIEYKKIPNTPPNTLPIALLSAPSRLHGIPGMKPSITVEPAPPD